MNMVYGQTGRKARTQSYGSKGFYDCQAAQVIVAPAIRVLFLCPFYLREDMNEAKH